MKRELKFKSTGSFGEERRSDPEATESVAVTFPATSPSDHPTEDYSKAEFAKYYERKRSVNDKTGMVN